MECHEVGLFLLILCFSQPSWNLILFLCPKKSLLEKASKLAISQWHCFIWQRRRRIHDDIIKDRPRCKTSVKYLTVSVLYRVPTFFGHYTAKSSNTLSIFFYFTSSVEWLCTKICIIYLLQNCSILFLYSIKKNPAKWKYCMIYSLYIYIHWKWNVVVLVYETSKSE